VAVGAGAGAPGAGVCWVAREVYGEADPRWRLFRSWLLTSAPEWFRDAYIAHGPAVAAWIHDKPAVKAGVRFLMDRAIEAHVADLRAAPTVALPCPGSE
jgi:hypothetical protein